MVYTENMASHSDSDEEETFVTLGTALEIVDDDEPLKKPVRVEDIQATDSKGRPRFHGAFTGGFSAGYFNSVGTQEGWTPATFVSSRDKRPEDKYGQRPEDFMDDEDLGEYGIAPRKYVTGSQFTSEERKKRTLVEANRATADSIIPGESALLNLIVPERITVGVKLLRKMGWKEGQGLGPRLSRKQKKKSEHKVYGCAMPPSPDSDDGLDDESVLSNITFAPKDCAQILLSAKDNTHGLGYRGLDPRKALPSSHINLFDKPRVTKGGASRKGIRGQGFGVGALEDEDDDIYAVDSMSNYDMTMGGENDDQFGWTGPSGKRQGETPVGYVGKMLDGFTLSSKKLVQKKDFPPPKLPRDFRPVHSFKKTEESDNLLATQSSSGVDYRQFLKPVDNSSITGSHQEEAGSSTVAGPSSNSKEDRNKYKDASARSLALGEKAFVGSVFDLIPQEDKNRMERVKQGTSQEEGPSTSTALVPSNTDTASSSSTQKTTTLEEHRQKNVPLFQGGFKPFHKDPGKQERYDKYLELVKLGHKDPYSLIMTSAQTEWEAEHEKEEFHQAAKLYRPLAGMMAMRFTRGGNVDDDTKDTKSEELMDTSDAGKATAMKMYGKLTRDVQEWHPDKLVCKRFNVPHPYPGSTIVGLPTIKRDKYSVFNFLNFSTPTEQDQTERSSHQEQSHNLVKEQPEGVPSESRVEKELNKSKNMKSIFSHLVETENNIQKNTKPVSFSVKSTKSNKPKEFKSIFSHLEKEKDSVKPRENIPVAMETESERKDGGQETKKDKNSDLLKKSSENKEGEPDMDLFRAIFRNTDSEDSSSSDEDETKKNSSIHDDEDTKDNSEKMETGPADDRLSTQGDRLPTEANIGVLPGNGEPMETLSSRLSPQLVSDESDSYGPALPPPLKDGNEDCTSSRTSHQSSDFIDLTKSDPPDYIDLTKRSSRKHKHKDKHKSKKDKKDKHKKSKHKKKNKKKEKKKKSKAQSDSSDTNTSDKDTDDDDDTITEREILNRLKSMKPRQRMRAADLL